MHAHPKCTISVVLCGSDPKSLPNPTTTPEYKQKACLLEDLLLDMHPGTQKWSCVVQK